MSSSFPSQFFTSGYERNREYIATQGPLPETIFDFWRMAWESDSTAIVMVSDPASTQRFFNVHLTSMTFI